MEITPEASVKIFGLPMEGFNAATLYNTWLVMLVLVVLAWLVSRSVRMVPGRLQSVFEGVTEFFEDVCDSTLGEDLGRKYMPFIGTLFLFVFLSNAIGIVPNLLAWAGWPGFLCPTQDLNTPLGLALIVLVVVHVSGIRIRGLREWLWSFFEPSLPGTGRAGRVLSIACLSGGVIVNFLVVKAYIVGARSMAPGGAIGGAVGAIALVVVSWLITDVAIAKKRVPNVLLAPLNFVGEAGKAISHPFRLFGNIFGGFVILTVVSELILHIGLPPLLNGFFGLFIGLVQAFVFAMLALAYVAVQVKD